MRELTSGVGTVVHVHKERYRFSRLQQESASKPSLRRNPQKISSYLCVSRFALQLCSVLEKHRLELNNLPGQPAVFLLTFFLRSFQVDPQL